MESRVDTAHVIISNYHHSLSKKLSHPCKKSHLKVFHEFYAVFLRMSLLVFVRARNTKHHNFSNDALSVRVYLLIRIQLTNEPPCGKTNNVVSKQIRHKPGCTSTQKMARDWKFWILKVEELYYPCSENKGADQLRAPLFSHMQIDGFPMRRLKMSVEYIT